MSSLLDAVFGRGAGTDPTDVRRGSQALPATAGGTSSAGAGSVSSSTADVVCAQVASDQAVADSVNRQVLSAEAALAAARSKREVDLKAGANDEENVRSSLVSAQNDLNTARTERPSLIAQQQAQVDAQAAVVANAQKDVDDTVLKAPVDGTVSAINGAVGEFLPGGSGTTALVPGGDAAIPGTGATSGTSSTTGAVNRPGGTQFIVLDDAQRFDAVVAFEESDASSIAPDQQVDVTFDAIPDLTRAGTVVAVSPASTSPSGVITFYVTVRLNDGDPRLRIGQTAQVAVFTQLVRDVSSVPNAAVQREGGQTTVTVVGPAGQRTVPFRAGAVGDDRTQVLSGLTVGDEVVLSSRAR